MNKKVLKTSLFGYSKLSVCEHIADLTEQFNARIFAIEESHEKEREELKERLAACEAELAEYKSIHSDIANALVEARQHAASIKAKAEEDFEKIIEENQKIKDGLAQRLKVYTASVESLKSKIVQFLKDTDDEVDDIIAQAKAVNEEFGEQ